MCGIAGVVSKEVTFETWKTFRVVFDCLRHRGPDGNDSAEHAFPGSAFQNFIFGHHRLAIIDLTARAKQPLYSKSGSILIINGEIYNSEKLREQLKNQYEFTTTSDSEVALAVLEIFGIAGVSKLDGMFAFAFYPAGDSSIWIGRDRLGIKPLYFARDKDDIWFSSEAKPLAKALKRGIDEIGISEWTQYHFQVSNRTFFNDIYSVPPGHLLTIKDGIIKSRQYWSIENHLSSNNGKRISYESAVRDLRDLLESSVKRHLMSDVEVATITSGGMDSSTVSTLAAQFGVQQSFLGRYSENGFDESEFAQSVANKANLQLKIVDLDEELFVSSLQEVVSVLDFPTAGPGSVGQYLVAREIAKTHRVVLAGTGGDELFLGYARDQFPLWSARAKSKASNDWLKTIPPDILGYHALFERFIAGGGQESPISGFMATLERHSIETPLLSIPKHRQIAVNSELRALISPTGGESINEVHDSLIRYEVSCFLPSLLHVEDRMTMAHGLESRVPLLDLELVEFLLALPASIRMAGEIPKNLLRRAMVNDLPQAVIDRKDKMGFPVPIGVWSQSGINKALSSILDNLAARQIPGVQVNRYFQQKNPSFIDSRELWGGVILECWLRSLE